MHTRILASIAAALMLTACGGGGGSGPTTSMENMPAPQPPAPTPTVADVHQANPGSTQTAAGQAASSLPAFGSVTQSANRDGASQVSTDRASTSFDANQYTLTIRRQGDTPITLSTVDDDYIAFEPEGSPFPGHDTTQDGFVLDYSERESTLAYVAITWDSADPMDYLSGGYWVHASGDILGEGAMIDGAGAFVDGPEISSPATMPVSGSATYNGEAEGLYATTYGSDQPRRQGETEIGGFYGDLALTANFSARTIGGCVGCGSGILVDGYASDYRIRLGSTPFENNGTFRSRSVTLENPNVPIASSSGAWGGRFSNIPNTVGDPRLVAGTLGGQATTLGGSEAVFVGAFYGLGQ